MHRADAGVQAAHLALAAGSGWREVHLERMYEMQGADWVWRGAERESETAEQGAMAIDPPPAPRRLLDRSQRPTASSRYTCKVGQHVTNAQAGSSTHPRRAMAMTTSSRDALPARSPMPLMVHSI